MSFLHVLTAISTIPLYFSLLIAPHIQLTPSNVFEIFESLILSTATHDSEVKKAEPFLSLPLRERDIPYDKLKVNEGWYYSDEERAIHGKNEHLGIDLDAPRGTPIVAAADGFAVRSYQAAETGRDYRGKSVGFALGEFVEIYHPQTGLYTLYGHMEKASDKIPYAESTQIDNKTWEPVGIYVSTEDFIEKARFVKRGEVIGYSGDSGITWGYTESFNTATTHLDRRDYARQPSWDETHLHFEIYTRSADGRKKDIRLDPYGIYKDAGPEGSNYKLEESSKEVLWLTNATGRPFYPD